MSMRACARQRRRSVAHQIELGDVSKTFATVRALDSVSLAARAGELLAITGPSGAGKTTLCRIVAGLETPDAGVCRIAGRDVGPVPAAARRVAYMFESYALYPHLTVRENVMSPLVAPNGRGTDIGVVDALLDVLEIRHLSARLPADLSGGQKQRVALARTLVQRPAVTLLDEPISHLDAKLRHKLRSEIRPHRHVAAIADALVHARCDGSAVGRGSRSRHRRGPHRADRARRRRLWRRPATVQVARLVGDPPMNLLPGRLESHAAGSSTFVCAELRIPLTGTLADAAVALGHDARAVLGVRPNLVALAPAGTSGSTAVELYSDEPFGKYAIATARLGDVLIKAKSARSAPARIGAPVGLVMPASGFVLFDAASGKAIAFESLAADDHNSRVFKDK